MFRLVTTVRRGTASNLPGSWVSYSTLDDARAAADALLKLERVQRIMIVGDPLQMRFVEWRNS